MSMPALASPRSSRFALALVVLLASACRDRTVKGVEEEMTEHHPDEGGVWLPIGQEVDILLIIDDSGSMAEEQRALAEGLPALLATLDDIRPGAHIRIGITSTDNGNPWCTADTPDAGNYLLSSCRSRPEQFTFEGAGIPDFYASSCQEICPEQWEQFETLPTELYGESGARSRPWLERDETGTNLPDGLSLEQALQCAVPLGIAGCGFESPLESMWKALRRSQTDDEAGWGFIRADAVLSVVFVTDEGDCSYNNEWESIFTPDGDRVFWSDPDAATPTSAVCWNAGVACEGTSPYDDCEPVDLDVEGLPVPRADADDEAVLRPVSRYIDYLRDLEDAKQRISPDQEVLVSVIGGVNTDGSVTYQDTDDISFQQDFGIGPGCASAQGSAVPPVRLRALADAFAVGDEPNMYSVCQSDYAPALSAIGEAIAAQLRPACMPACVADSDPDTPQLEPTCTIIRESPNLDGTIDELEVMPCGPDEAVPPGADVCYVPVVGDDRAPRCIDSGFNLEIRVIERPGVVLPDDTRYIASCELSSDRDTDCPDLP